MASSVSFMLIEYYKGLLKGAVSTHVQIYFNFKHKIICLKYLIFFHSFYLDAEMFVYWHELDDYHLSRTKSENLFNNKKKNVAADTV